MTKFNKHSRDFNGTISGDIKLNITGVATMLREYVPGPESAFNNEFASEEEQFPMLSKDYHIMLKSRDSRTIHLQDVHKTILTIPGKIGIDLYKIKAMKSNSWPIKCTSPKEQFHCSAKISAR